MKPIRPIRRAHLWFGSLALALTSLAGVLTGAPVFAGGGAAWSSAVAVSPANQPDPTRGSQLNAVAVNASGLAIAAWDQFTYNGSGGATIGAAVQAGGRWGGPFTISGATGYSTTPSVAVGADGTMAVSWTYQDPATTTPQRQKIQVAVKRASDAAWATRTLDEGPVTGVAVIPFVPLGVDRFGNVTAAWTMVKADGRHTVKAATLKAGTTAWEAPAALSGDDDGLYLSLAVNQEGNAAVAYSLSPYTAYTTGTSARVVTRLSDGTWTAPATVSEHMPSTVGYITGPRIALDAYGLATVVYMGYGVEAVRQTTAAAQGYGGTWTTPTTVISATAAGSSYLGYDLAVDNAGNAIVAASIFDATVGVNRATVFVTRQPAGGAWTRQQRLTDPTVPVDAYAACAAVSPDGSLALVGWIDHYHGTVQVSKWTGSAWGAATTIARGSAFSSFQEVLGLDVGSGSVAVAIWKNTAKGGTRTMASSYR